MSLFALNSYADSQNETMLVNLLVHRGVGFIRKVILIE